MYIVKCAYIFLVLCILIIAFLLNRKFHYLPEALAVMILGKNNLLNLNFVHSKSTIVRNYLLLFI